MEPSSRRMLLQFWIIQFLRSFGKFLHRSEISSIKCKLWFCWHHAKNGCFLTRSTKLPVGYHPCYPIIRLPLPNYQLVTSWINKKAKDAQENQDPTIGSKHRSTLAHCKATGLGRQCHTTITKVTPAWKHNKSLHQTNIKGMPKMVENGVAGFEKYARFVDLLNIKTAQSATVSSIWPQYLIWTARLRRRWLSASSCGRRRRGWSAHGGTFSVIQDSHGQSSTANRQAPVIMVSWPVLFSSC